MNEKEVALIYDFDDTLSPGNMQEVSLIPSLKITSEEFWNEVSRYVELGEMDRILSYMYLVLKIASEQKIQITKKYFENIGANIVFFEGVLEWFDRINAYGKKLGLNIHHYIISSGTKEIIDGTKIAEKFDKIFACTYLYSDSGLAVWPALAINYTNKTQYLYRINKGLLDVRDDHLNDYMLDKDRAIPFSNMIYIGDGMTDVPCMKLVKANGGNSIAVYNSEKSKILSCKLYEEDRVNHIASSIYTCDSDIDKYIKKIFEKIANKNSDLNEKI